MAFGADRPDPPASPSNEYAHAPANRIMRHHCRKLPVPFDRRVWQEAQALTRAGWRVAAICPSNESYPAPFEVIDDIAIYRHPLPRKDAARLPIFSDIPLRCFMSFGAFATFAPLSRSTKPELHDFAPLGVARPLMASSSAIRRIVRFTISLHHVGHDDTSPPSN